MHLADAWNHLTSNGLRYISNPPGNTARVHQHMEMGKGEVPYDEVFAALACERVRRGDLVVRVRLGGGRRRREHPAAREGPSVDRQALHELISRLVLLDAPVPRWGRGRSRDNHPRLRKLRRSRQTHPGPSMHPRPYRGTGARQVCSGSARFMLGRGDLRFGTICRVAAVGPRVEAQPHSLADIRAPTERLGRCDAMWLATCSASRPTPPIRMEAKAYWKYSPTK